MNNLFAFLLAPFLYFSYVILRNIKKMFKVPSQNMEASQLDGTIADEGTSFSDIAGSPHMHGNITDIWGQRTVAIKQKSKKK